MKDFSKYSLEKNGIPTDVVKEAPGERNAVTTLCPKCSKNRSTAAHRRAPVLHVNLDTGYCHCYHCGEVWRIDSNAYLEKKDQAEMLAKSRRTYIRPKVKKPEEGEEFSEKMVKYLTETRKIPMEFIRLMKVTQEMEYMPQTKKVERCIVFNYFEQGFLVNKKFRDGSKNFKMVQGAELIPYNIDSCLGEEELIVVEGEFDALAFLVAGFKSVVSIPSGANGNTDWMNRFYELYFSDKKRVYIATDMDAPGIKAAEEIIRRFGPEVCLRVSFSEGCKDANDVLVKNGSEALKSCIENAVMVPMKDICTVENIESELDAFYLNGPEPGKETGWKNLDEIVTFGTGQLALITGRTNDGKSEWLDELVIRLLIRYNWTAGFWTPENTLLDHSRKIIEKLTNRTFIRQGATGVQPQQFELCKLWMKERISWIDLPFDNLHLETILERSRSLVRKFGIRILVLDPFNFIEKENNATRSENAWDSHVVGAIRSFAVRNNVLVFLVAHPRKVEMQVDGRKRRITLEDSSGTADFGNKTDYCFCIDRDDVKKVVTVSVDKVRRKQFGSKGLQAFFVYNKNSGRYYPCSVDENKNVKEVDYYSDQGFWLNNRDLFGNEIKK